MPQNSLNAIAHLSVLAIRRPRSYPFSAMGHFRQIAVRAPLLAIAVGLSACAVSSPSIERTSQVVASPVKGELSVSVNKAPAVGQVVPVQVSVANGTDIPRAVVPNQIFAINQVGERVAPLPAGEAARQAGGAKELKGALKSAAVNGVEAGAMGAGLGAAVGAVTGSVVETGSIIGGAIGAGSGMLSVVQSGQDPADQDAAAAQLNSLALQPQDVAHDFTVSGYVFFPKGDYQQIQILMINRETGDTELVTRPWP